MSNPVSGAATSSPTSTPSLANPPTKLRARFAENVQLVDQLWRTDGPVTWSGAFRADLVDVEVHPRPIQRPRPPIWIGAGFSPESIKLAVDVGAWLMVPTVLGSWEMFLPSVEAYIEQDWDASGRDPAERRIGCCSHFWVGPDSEAARARWAPRYLHYLKSINGWISQAQQRAGNPPLDLPWPDFEQSLATVGICGSVDEVVNRMGDAAELLHLDTQLLMMDMGGAPTDELLGTIALTGAEGPPPSSVLLRSARCRGRRCYR